MPDPLAERARAVLNTVLTLAALFVIGPLASWPIALLHGPDGGQTSTLLISDGPFLGVVSLVILFLAAALIGLIKAKLFGWGRGLFAAGLVLAWGAARTGNMDDLYFVSSDPSPVARLVIETLLVAVLTAGLAVVLLRWSSSDTDPNRPEIPGAREPGLMASKASLLAVVAAAVGMVAFCWVFVQTPLRLQALAGGACAAIGAGAIATMIAMQVGGRMTTLAPILGILLIGLVAPIAGQILANGGLGHAARAGSLTPIASLQPLDWAAAAMLGVPVGIGWAASLLEKQLAEADHPTPRRRSPA